MASAAPHLSGVHHFVTHIIRKHICGRLSAVAAKLGHFSTERGAQGA